MRFFLLLSLVAAAFALTPVQKTFLSAKEELEVQCNSVPDNPGGCNNAMGHCEFCILHSTYCSQPDITNIVNRCSGGGNFQDCLCAKTEH